MYSNENFAMPVVDELRRLGHDVVTSFEAGNANASIPDDEGLHWASSEGRMLLTHNRLHFLRLHQRRKSSHAGIIVCTFDPDFARQAHRIHSAIETDLADCLIRVNRPA